MPGPIRRASNFSPALLNSGLPWAPVVPSRRRPHERTPRTTAGPRPVHGRCILWQSPGPPWLPAHPPHSSQFLTLSSLCPCSADIPTQTLGATQHNMGSSSSKQKASSQDDSAKTTASPTPAHPPAAPETATALEAPAATVHAKPSRVPPEPRPRNRDDRVNSDNPRDRLVNHCL